MQYSSSIRETSLRFLSNNIIHVSIFDVNAFNIIFYVICDKMHRTQETVSGAFGTFSLSLGTDLTENSSENVCADLCRCGKTNHKPERYDIEEGGNIDNQ